MSRLAILLLLTAPLLAPPAVAVEFTVTRTDDPQPTGTCDPGDCSLREAILAANALAGPDVVTLSAGTYDVSGPGAYEDAAAFGDLDVTDDLMILGSGADTTTINDLPSFTGPTKVFHIDPAQSGIVVEIADVTIQSPVDNRPLQDLARCVLNDGTLVLSRVVVRDCTHGGPALYNSFAGTLSVIDSTVRDNATTACGGGIASGGTLTVINSTISNNEGSCGGGVSANELNLVNSTISGNTSTESGGGLITGGPARLSNVTITDNTTDSTFGGIGGGGIRAFGTVEVSNTIIAGNTDLGGLADDCDGAFTSLGYNLLGDDTNCTVTPAAGDRFGTGARPIDPLLEQLDDNGGATATHLLSEGSSAINAGNPSGCTWDDDSDGGTPEVALTTDQRGEPRPSPNSPICDIGAVEVLPEPASSVAALLVLGVLVHRRRRSNRRGGEAPRANSTPD